MNLRPGFSFRIALLYFLIIGSVFWFILHKALDTLDASVRQAAEGVMVDSANLVAEHLSQQTDDDRLRVDTLEKLIPAYLERRLDARIWSIIKTSPDMQLYVTDDVASVARPIRELVGFARVSIPAGETRNVTFTVDPSRLAFHGLDMRLVTEPGSFTFRVGGSSAEGSEVQVELEGDVAGYERSAILATTVAVTGG